MGAAQDDPHAMITVVTEDGERVKVRKGARSATDRLQAFLGSEVQAMVKSYEERYDVLSVFKTGDAEHARGLLPVAAEGEGDGPNWRVKKYLEEKKKSMRHQTLKGRDDTRAAERIKEFTEAKAGLIDGDEWDSDDQGSGDAQERRWQPPIQRKPEAPPVPLWRLILDDAEVRAAVAREVGQMTRLARLAERSLGQARMPTVIAPAPAEPEGEPDHHGAAHAGAAQPQSHSDEVQRCMAMDMRSAELATRLQAVRQRARELRIGVTALRRAARGEPVKGRRPHLPALMPAFSNAAEVVNLVLGGSADDDARAVRQAHTQTGTPATPTHRLFPVHGYSRTSAPPSAVPPARGPPGQVAVLHRDTERCIGVWACSQRALRCRTVAVAASRLVLMGCIPARALEGYATGPVAEMHLRLKEYHSSVRLSVADLRAFREELPPIVAASARVRQLCRELFECVPKSVCARGWRDDKLSADGYLAFTLRLLQGFAPSRCRVDDVQVAEDCCAQLAAAGRGWAAFLGAILGWVTLCCRPLRGENDAAEFLVALRDWIHSADLTEESAAASFRRTRRQLAMHNDEHALRTRHVQPSPDLSDSRPVAALGGSECKPPPPPAPGRQGWDVAQRRIPGGLDQLLAAIPPDYAEGVRTARLQYLQLAKSVGASVRIGGSPSGSPHSSPPGSPASMSMSMSRSRPGSPASTVSAITLPAAAGRPRARQRGFARVGRPELQVDDDPLRMFRRDLRLPPAAFPVGTRVEAHGLEGARSNLNGVVGTVLGGHGLLGPDLAIVRFPEPNGDLPVRPRNLRTAEDIRKLIAELEARGELGEVDALRNSLMQVLGEDACATPGTPKRNRMAALVNPMRAAAQAAKQRAQRRASVRDSVASRSDPAGSFDGNPLRDADDSAARKRRCAWRAHVRRRIAAQPGRAVVRALLPGAPRAPTPGPPATPPYVSPRWLAEFDFTAAPPPTGADKRGGAPRRRTQPHSGAGGGPRKALLASPEHQRTPRAISCPPRAWCSRAAGGQPPRGPQGELVPRAATPAAQSELIAAELKLLDSQSMPPYTRRGSSRLPYCPMVDIQ